MEPNQTPLAAQAATGRRKHEEVERAIRQIADRQCGLVHRRQLYDTGLTDDHLRYRVQNGMLQRVRGDVFRVVGSGIGEDRRLLAAALDAAVDGVLSHDTAATMWRFHGFRRYPIQVMGHRSANFRSPLAVVHRPTLLLPCHVVFRADGMPVTTPTRTLFDLAGQVRSPTRMGQLVDTAWSNGLTRWRSLETMLGQLACRGRPGIAVMRSVLDGRGPEYVPAASNLERRFEQLVASAGLTPMDRQVDVGDDAHWIGRVDFRDAELPFVVEVQSDLHHSSETDRARDRTRIAALEAAGWTVLEVDEFDLWYRGDEVVSRVKDARFRSRLTNSARTPGS